MTMEIPAQQTGLAHLPRNGGYALASLFQRITNRASEITTVIIDHGPDEMLRRLAGPFRFRRFGCVPAYDWHLCGVSSVACGALEAGLAGTGHERGSFVAEDKGKAAQYNPANIDATTAVPPTDPAERICAGRDSARVDSVPLQNGCNLYPHRTRWNERRAPDS